MVSFLKGCSPVPRTFLGFMSLQTGTEMVSLAMLFNKVSGLYGLLAILTGYSLSALQLSMYIYNVLTLVALAILLRHIRRPTSALENVALAWLYMIDTFINVAYTAVFAALWFTATSSTPEDKGTQEVEVPPRAVEGVHESGASVAFIVIFTLVRVYFSLVVMAHARQVLQQCAEGRAGWDGDDNDKAIGVGSPFAKGASDGKGWRGRLGRALTAVPRSFWLGHKRDEEWMKEVSSRLRNHRRAGSAASLVGSSAAQACGRWSAFFSSASGRIPL